MAFKRDWSFLDKITMGSVGTKRVIEILNAEGHQIIELERYCTSNKIWSTKIKRLRIPDLLCLRCGKRIESRAKSKLGIIMSDSKNNLDRRWYSGLRKSDLVAFVQCHRNVEGLWEASRTINLFSVGDMLSKESLTKLSAPKSVYEGAERDREWKCYIPGYDFKVVAIEKGKDGTRIKFMTPTGKRHSRVIASDHYVYVNEGDNFLGKEKIVSGIVPSTYDCHCTGEQYDFIKDLKSEENETKYTAIKALGFLPPNNLAIHERQCITKKAEMDARIKLEAFATLIKLGIDLWDDMYSFVFSSTSEEIKMEYVLILGELNLEGATTKLIEVINNSSNNPEVRAAAVWSLPNDTCTLLAILNQCFSSEEILANHAIAKIEKYFSPEMTPNLLSLFGEDEHNNAICSHILAMAQAVNKKAIVKHYIAERQIKLRNWILFSIGISGRNGYEESINMLDIDAKDTLNKLALLWDCHDNFMSKEQQEGIEFIKRQK